MKKLLLPFLLVSQVCGAVEQSSQNDSISPIRLLALESQTLFDEYQGRFEDLKGTDMKTADRQFADRQFVQATKSYQEIIPKLDELIDNFTWIKDTNVPNLEGRIRTAMSQVDDEFDKIESAKKVRDELLRKFAQTGELIGQTEQSISGLSDLIGQLRAKFEALEKAKASDKPKVVNSASF